MATLTSTRYFIECDGCGEWFGAPGGASAMEIRAAAYAAGWRFPNQLGRGGGLVKTTSDVCPVCIPGWEPRQRAPRARLVSVAEMAERMGGEA